MMTAALAVLMSAAVPGFGGELPLSVGGFTLGRPIETVAERVIMETALPVRYMENLHEVEIRPVAGFKSGLIAYGTCRQPPSIVRIKLKYEDGGHEFYEELLRRFKKKYGEPTEYMGDAFRVFISWKWSFADADGNRISLTLQHNMQDEEEKMGNAVKLTLQNRLEEDGLCFKEKRLDRRKVPRQSRPPSEKPGATAWDLFVPK